jgi:hypothetical protein
MLRKHIIRDVLSLAELYRPSWPGICASIERSGVPTMHVAEDAKRQLRDVQAAVSAANNEYQMSRQAFEKARDAVSRLDVSPVQLTGTSEYRAAEAALAVSEQAKEKLENLREAENGLLQMSNGPSARGGRDGNGYRSGDVPAGDGWAQVASELRLSEGQNRVNLPLSHLLHSPAMAAVSVTPSTGLTQPSVMAPLVELARDERHLWMVLPSGELLDPETASISDYRQTGSRTVVGSVERDPVALTPEKATLALELELVNTPLRQFAVICDEIPFKLFDYAPTLQAWLQSEMSYQISLALDQHVLAQILAASPPSGSSGATLIEKARNGVKEARKVGANPRVLALNPDDSADLDVQKTGTEGLQQYIFASRDSGSASPLWGNAIVEVPGLESPMLLDPAILGAFYAGQATVLADPYTQIDVNGVRLRVEMEALGHIRDRQGAYIIA